jgi:hypothetical protein
MKPQVLLMLIAGAVAAVVAYLIFGQKRSVSAHVTTGAYDASGNFFDASDTNSIGAPSNPVVRQLDPQSIAYLNATPQAPYIIGSQLPNFGGPMVLPPAVPNYTGAKACIRWDGNQWCFYDAVGNKIGTCLPDLSSIDTNKFQFC